MDLTFTKSEIVFRDEIKTWLSENKPSEQWLPMDTETGFEQHRAWELELFNARWSVPNWPEEYGGRECSLIEWLLFEEEYYLSGAPGRVNTNGITLLGPTLFEWGTKEQKDRFLLPMAQGKEIWAQGWSEPNTGSDLASLTTTAFQDGENYVFSFESLITEECSNLIPERWNVPVTWIIDINQTEVFSITSESGVMENIVSERHTKEGYTHVQGQYLHLSVVNGNRVDITIGEGEYDVLGISEFWNNHTAAITIASHETTDLFKWSKRFVDQDDLIFTWLVQPRPVDGDANWIPYVAFSVGVGVILTMLLVLKREGLGPLAKKEK